MAKTVYDMVKLETLGEIDVGYAIGHNGSYQAYFDKLNQFVEMPKKYFCEYNPTVVIYDEDTCSAFLSEVASLIEEYTSLGLNTMVSALTDLEQAVEKKSVGSLSDWIMGLDAKAEQLAKLLMTARIAGNDTAASPEPVISRPREKPLILAVDDKPELLTVLVNTLKDNYTVMGATSGPAALKMLKKHSPRLFLLDIEMPEMDGYRLAKIIRRDNEFTKVPIIFLTGRSTRDAVVTAMANGGNDYIVKPVDKDILIDKIEKYLPLI